MLNLLQKKRQDESGAGIIIAVLVMVIMVAILTLMTYTSVRSLEKGSSIQNLNASQNAADTAIANMFATVNGVQNRNNVEIEKHIGKAKARYGTFQANEIDPNIGDGSYTWKWWAEKPAEFATGTTYDITAVGYLNEETEPEARTLKVQISSTTTEGVSYDPDNSVAYIATIGGSFAFGGLGTSRVETGENVKMNTYNSNNLQPITPLLDQGNLASNGSMLLGNGTKGKLIFLGLRANKVIDETVCSGTACGTNANNSYDYKTSLSYSRAQALAKCPASVTAPDWIASKNNGVIAYDSGVKCYNNIIFDVDTNLSAVFSTGNPAVMYARGNVTVKPGVEVSRQNSNVRGPYALQIVGSGATKFNMEHGQLTNATKFTGVVVGANMECNIGTGTGTDSTATNYGTNFYGSVACNTLKVGKNTTMWWDNQLDKVTKEGSLSSKKIWSATSYEEL